MNKYYKAQNYARLHHSQAGMTLIELTVVLLILVALAGLLIPYVGSFVQKSHDSTNSNNLAQLNSAFIRFVAEENRLPHHLDTLTNNAATAGTGVCAGPVNAGDPYCGLLDATVFSKVTYAQPVDPMAPTGNAEIAYASLEKGKINMLVNNNTAAPNKTFGSQMGMVYIGGGSATAAPNFLTVAGVPMVGPGMSAGSIEGHMAVALGKAPMDYNSTCYDYVVLGLGDANGLVGKTIASSPVHFPEDATKGPVEYYNHYAAVLQVDKDNTTAGCSSVTEAAKFLGAVMNVPNYPGSHLFGVNAALGYTYDNQLAGK
jgi:type II secretory pathway pseudopilin PulG